MTLYEKVFTFLEGKEPLASLLSEPNAIYEVFAPLHTKEPYICFNVFSNSIVETEGKNEATISFDIFASNAQNTNVIAQALRKLLDGVHLENERFYYSNEKQLQEPNEITNFYHHNIEFKVIYFIVKGA